MLDWTVPRWSAAAENEPVLRHRHQRLQMSELHRY